MCFRGIDIIGDLARWGEGTGRDMNYRGTSRGRLGPRAHVRTSKTSRCRARDRDRVVTSAGKHGSRSLDFGDAVSFRAAAYRCAFAAMTNIVYVPNTFLPDSASCISSIAFASVSSAPRSARVTSIAISALPSPPSPDLVDLERRAKLPVMSR